MGNAPRFRQWYRDLSTGGKARPPHIIHQYDCHSSTCRAFVIAPSKRLEKFSKSNLSTSFVTQRTISYRLERHNPPPPLSMCLRRYYKARGSSRFIIQLRSGFHSLSLSSPLYYRSFPRSCVKYMYSSVANSTLFAYDGGSHINIPLRFKQMCTTPGLERPIA